MSISRIGKLIFCLFEICLVSIAYVQHQTAHKSWSHGVMRSWLGTSIRPKLYAILDKMYTRKPYNEKPSMVLDDFDHIIEAIHLFKQIFEGTEIPLKFEVPAQEPWPLHLHGLRLGKRLEKLIGTEEFFEKHPEKVEALRLAGFETTKVNLLDDWAMILKAVKIYTELNQNCRIPSKYIVPDEAPWPRICAGLKLGVRVAAIRSAGRYIKGYPERKAALDELGFEWKLRDLPTKETELSDDEFESLFEGLSTYKTIYGDLNIFENFVIPNEEPWDTELWGLPLGEQVQYLREKERFYISPGRERRLIDLGFTWEESAKAIFSKKRFDIIYEALKIYKETYGNVFVPQSFVVPSELPWPLVCWGVKLGARVNAIRCQGTLVSNYPDRKKLLDDLGFSWELPIQIKRRKRITTGEEASFDEEADGEDSDSSSDTETSVEQQQASLGSTHTSTDRSLGTSPSTVETVRSVRESQIEKMKKEVDLKSAAKEQINSLGIPDDVKGQSNSEFKEALGYDPSRMFQPISYREIAGEAMREYLHSRDMSPDPDIRERAHFEGHLSPEEYHHIITRSISDEDIKKMKETGYKILEFGPFNWKKVIEAFRIYKNHYGNLDIPYEYSINEEVLMDEGIGFDDSFEDMLLGEIVHGLRIGDIDGYEDPERRKALDDLGFEWGDLSKYQRYRFVPMILGLKVYKHLYAFPVPQYDFVVPDEPQWPYWMVGMPLGEWAAVARVQQQLIEEHYPDRKDMFTALEFLWWIPPGNISRKYYQPLK